MCGVSVVVGACVFFFQAEDGIRDLVRSRGLGDVYKRQTHNLPGRPDNSLQRAAIAQVRIPHAPQLAARFQDCLLYTSDAADERSSVDLGGRRIIKKKTTMHRCCVVRHRSNKNTRHHLPTEPHLLVKLGSMPS